MLKDKVNIPRKQVLIAVLPERKHQMEKCYENNPIDKAHLYMYDTLKGKSRDYTELDTLMEEIRAYRPNASVEVVGVELT